MNTFQSIECLLEKELITQEQADQMFLEASTLPSDIPSILQLMIAKKMTATPAVAVTITAPDGAYAGAELIITGGTGPYQLSLNGVDVGIPVSSPTTIPENDPGDELIATDSNGIESNILITTLEPVTLFSGEEVTLFSTELVTLAS